MIGLQREICSPCNIFEENGKVMQAGWARTPVFIRNEEQSKSLSRHCEREVFFVNNSEVSLYLAVENYAREFAIKIAVADLLHGGVISDYVRKKTHFTRYTLPNGETGGRFDYEDKDIRFILSDTVNGRLLQCAFSGFGGSHPFACKLTLRADATESLNEIAPFERNRKYFYFKQYDPGYTALGTIKVGSREYSLNENTTRAYLDKTHFFKPREHNYQRLSADCTLGGNRFSLNLASRVGDNRYGNENCFFYGGKLEKLSQISIKGTQNRIDRPYYFRGGVTAVDIMFKPFTVQGKAMRADMGSTTVVFGRLYGRINRVDYDKPLELDNAQAHMIFSEF